MTDSIQKIILFGGSFDPIHKGHLTVAEFAFDQLDGDRLFFIPARRSPHKSEGPFASGQARLTMIRLAIAGRDRFETSDCELRRPPPSYTLDTVRHFRQVFGSSAEFFWLVGADAANDLGRWYHIDELLDACRLCIMHRGGMPSPRLDHLIKPLGAQRVAQLERHMLATPRIEADSTAIRARLAAGKSVEDLLPPAVLDYIRRERLYA